MKAIDLIIKNEIIKSFEEAYSSKNINNQIRSKLFVSELAKRIYCHYDSDVYSKNCMEIGNKEWLLDAFITKKKIFNNNNKYPIRYFGEWAIESEFKTSYGSFSKDFSKLLNIKSKNFLYINGIDHLKPANREKYIKERLSVVNEILNSMDDNTINLKYGFCPPPNKREKIVTMQLGENKKILDLIKVFKFTYSPQSGKYDFIELE
jgi:hypothetical protein